MSKNYFVHTKNTTYAIGVDDNRIVRHLYWGRRICDDMLEIPDIWDSNSNHSDLDNAMTEYTPFGGKMYRNCAFKCRYFDKCRESELCFSRAHQDENELVLVLEDKVYNLEVKLHYVTYDDSDIITRFVELCNRSENEILIEKMMSAEISLPSELPYTIVNTNGSWGAEFQQESTVLKTGSVVFESRKGTTGHTNQPTFIAHQGASEDSGPVYFAALGYSGSFKVEAQRDFKGKTRAIIGVNDFDFSYTLKGGETVFAPKVYLGVSDGFAEMSNKMSKFAVLHILPSGFAKKPLPVLYNSWEATAFDVNTKHQLSLAQKAADLGCELFVMDDGWFGKRNDDRAGLGDWVVNEEKFPNGIDELIEGVNKLGMDFGLWFEPEMVQRDSDLFRAYPDWIYHYPTRENKELRNQLVLNLTKPEVEQYVFDCMDKMLEKHNIRYIKWDMNRPFSESGAENLENAQELWLRHTEAVYRVADRLKEKYPYLQLEACASGGGRADLGALEHFDMVWTSDNTDPLDRLTIQRGFSQLYPVKCMRAWVTDWNNNRRRVSLDFRFLSSMQGSLSLGANLNEYTSDELETAKHYIALYKEIRNTIQFGNLYRLKNEYEHEYWANEYVLGDEAVLFVMTLAGTLDNKHTKNLTLRGLEENSYYSYSLDGKEYTHSGGYLMNKGLDLNLYNPLDSKIIRFKKVD